MEKIHPRRKSSIRLSNRKCCLRKKLIQESRNDGEGLTHLKQEDLKMLKMRGEGVVSLALNVSRVHQFFKTFLQ